MKAPPGCALLMQFTTLKAKRSELLMAGTQHNMGKDLKKQS